MFCPVLSWCVDKLNHLGQDGPRQTTHHEVATNPEVANEAIEKHDRAGERSIGLAQVAIGAVVLSLHLISAIRHDFQTFSPLVSTILIGFIASSIMRFKCAGRASFRENTFTALTIIDSALLVGVIWAYCVAYNLPFEASVKSPTLVLLFTFIGLRALRFSCSAAMLSVVAIIGCWAVAFTLLATLSPTVSVAKTYEEFLSSSAILIGAEFEKLIAIVINIGFST